METLAELAERHLDWAMPGYTHLQRAQPVYLSHHLLAYFWMLDRDRERFDAVLRGADRLPLGAGALAGVNFATDRRALAQELGFSAVAENSIDAVSNRDFVLDFLAAAATARPICHAWAARSCCGPARSSGSARSPTPSPRAPRSCRRRRTPTPPSCCAPRRRAWPATLSRCSACSTACP